MTRGTSTVRAGLAVAAVLVVAGCGGATEGGAMQAPLPTTATTGVEPAQGPPEPLPGSEPPAVTVRGASGPLDLEPWTWCWSGRTGGGCADGAPPQDPSDVGAAEQVTVSFPVPGWTFAATFRPVGQECAREQRVDLVTAAGDGGSTSGGTLAPAGPAGAYDVDLSGRGPGGNDVNVTFRWTTPADGPAPAPQTSIAVLDESDGQVRGHGISLGVTDLAAAPREASAHVTVTSSRGASLDLDPGAEIGTCSSEGSVWFTGTYEQAQQAAALGSAPFTYDVVLTLDGVEHRATAVWPRDERPGTEESSVTPLRFTPPLPSVAP